MAHQICRRLSNWFSTFNICVICVPPYAAAALADAEQEAAARVARLERDLQFNAVDLKMCGEKMDKLEKDKANIERELRVTLPELATAEKACERAAADVAKLEGAVNEIEDAVYADFSESVGVANIREYEAHNLAMLQKAAEERAKFTQQRAKLTEQLNFERSRDTEGPRGKAESDIAKHKAELERLAAAAAKTKAEAEASKGILEGWERDATAARSEAEAIDAEVKELRARQSALGQEGAKLQRLVGNKTATVDALREQRADIIVASRMERLKLPRAEDDGGGGGDDEDMLALPGPEGGGGGGSGDDDDDDEMDVDGEGGGGGRRGGGGGGGGGEGAGWREAAHKVKLDYSNLSPRLKEAPRATQRERLDEELRAATEAKTAALTKLAPNMKAIHKYEVGASRCKLNSFGQHGLKPKGVWFQLS